MLDSRRVARVPVWVGSYVPCCVHVLPRGLQVDVGLNPVGLRVNQFLSEVYCWPRTHGHNQQIRRYFLLVGPVNLYPSRVVVLVADLHHSRLCEDAYPVSL